MPGRGGRGASGCCRFGQQTFAGTHGNGRNAPKPAVRLTAMERPGSDPEPTLERELTASQPPAGIKRQILSAKKLADLRTKFDDYAVVSHQTVSNLGNLCKSHRPVIVI